MQHVVNQVVTQGWNDGSFRSQTRWQTNTENPKHRYKIFVSTSDMGLSKVFFIILWLSLLQFYFTNLTTSNHWVTLLLFHSVVNGTIRSAFEFGGQKCSACSRAYVPKSLWPQVRDGLLDKHKDIKMGNVRSTKKLLCNDNLIYLKLQC